MQWNSFHRARRFGPPPAGGAALVWTFGALASVALILLVLLLATVTDLLVNRGAVSATKADQDELTELAGQPDVPGKVAEYHDRGLLPLVWQWRGTSLGHMLANLYGGWPALRGNQSALVALVVTSWGLAIAFALLLFALSWSTQRSARDTVRLLRRGLYQQSVRLGAGDLLLGQRQNAVELFTEKVETLGRGLAAWSRAVPHALLLVFLLVGTAMYVNLWLAAAAILLAVLSRYMLVSLRSASERRASLWADLAGQKRSSLVEDLRQVRSLGNFSPASVPSGESFDERLRECHAAALRQHVAAAPNSPSVTLFVLAGAGLVVLLAGVNVLHEPPRLTLSGAVLLLTSLATLVYPLRIVQQLSRALPDAERAAADIMAYLDRHPAVGQVPEARSLQRPAKQLSLVNVRLADASGRKLLDDVSLDIACGSRTAVIASDPETPLAFIGLLPRFYDPAAGRILFDGQDIGRATLASVRSEVGVLLPERILVTGTVTENIACDDPRFSPADVIEAARRSLAYDIVQELPHGFDTIVGDHGQHLSASEALLIGVARLLLRNPSVVILGEAVDGMDPALEALVAESIERVAKGRTMVVLARSLPTLRAAERILLFHEGKLHGDGSHVDLLADSELYRHLNYVRFNEFRNQVSSEW